MNDERQRLVDLNFSMLMACKANMGWLARTSREDLAAWARKHYADSGFTVEPQGSSWGVLR